MRHDHHAAAEVLEEVLQHRQGLNVEVVGGLIEQQNVGGLDQQAAEVQPPPFAAGELANRLVLLGGREQEALQQLRGREGAAIELDAAGGVLHHIDQLALAAGGIGGLEHLMAVLIEVGQLHGATQFDPAAVGQPPPGDQIQEGGFARAVGADDAHPIFRAEVVAELPQQRRRTGLPRLGAGPHRQLVGLDRPFAEAATVAAEAELPLHLPLRLLLHRLDALDAGLLLGAARLGATLQPLELAPQHATGLGLTGNG